MIVGADGGGEGGGSEGGGGDGGGVMVVARAAGARVAESQVVYNARVHVVVVKVGAEWVAVAVVVVEKAVGQLEHATDGGAT